jgi:nucleoside-diphosphate-sugar epimerase
MAPTVLLLGSTGVNGKLVLEGLVQRGCSVRAVARSAASLGQLGNHKDVTVIEGSFLDMTPDTFRAHVDGCDAVISCLGHNLNFRGLYRDPPLCTEATRMVCSAIESLKRPTKFVLHSSAGVDNPNGKDPRRGLGERLVMALIRVLAPPHPDNEGAANFLGTRATQPNDPVEWVCVRPDDLIEGEVSEYRLSETLLNGLFDAKVTTRRNVADFMCRLVTEEECWQQWRGKMPMIVDAQQGSVAKKSD